MKEHEKNESNRERKDKTKQNTGLLKTVFGGLKITWPKLIIFAVAMGTYTALMAMFVPDGNSFHDIAVSPEWWVLPAIIIIANAKKPLEAALKTFVFFLVSQPLVYLIQVPFSDNGWSLFGYYPYWFKITLLTFPGAFLGWYIKKDEWYSGLILSVMTVLLALTGVGCIRNFIETPPNHLITAIYCFAIIPVFIFGIFKNKTPRIVTAVITAVAILIYLPAAMAHPFEAYNNSFLSENEITLVGEPYISKWSGEGKGSVEIIEYEGGYNFRISGDRGKKYTFTVSDDEHEYEFEYYFDKELQTVVVKKL